MTLVVKIAAGILIAASIIGIVRFSIDRAQYDAQVKAANEAMAAMASSLKAIPPATPIQPSRVTSPQPARVRYLEAGQQCLGGFAGRTGTVIVRSVANGVPQAVQLIENGRPVQCVGDHRLN